MFTYKAATKRIEKRFFNDLGVNRGEKGKKHVYSFSKQIIKHLKYFSIKPKSFEVYLKSSLTFKNKSKNEPRVIGLEGRLFSNQHESIKSV
jgi:hypothetical protein